VLDHTHQVQAGNLNVENDVNGICDGASFQYPGQFGVGWGAMGFSLDEFVTAPQVSDQSMPQYISPYASDHLRPASDTINAPYSRVLCVCPGCNKTFTRDSDARRHFRTIHQAPTSLHLCSIPECPKGQGAGYSRINKLKEHLRLKHGQ